MKLEFFPGDRWPCPLVLVYGREREALMLLAETFRALSTGEKATAALHLLPGFASVGGCELHCVMGKRSEGLTRLGKGLVFRWEGDSEDWIWAAELVDPFLSFYEGPGVSFQYLDDLGDTCVVLSTARAW